MKKKLLVLAGVLAVFSASAQAQWINQPVALPAPAEIVFQLSAVDASAAWATTFDTAAGENTKRLVHTRDGGQTWNSLIVSGLSADDYVTSVCGLDASTAWVSVGSSSFSAGGKLLKTSNGGQTWTAASGVFINNGSLPRQVKFSDATRGIAVGEGINSTSAFEVLTTSNGGASWQQTIAGSIPGRIPGEQLVAPVPTLQVLGTRVWFVTDKGRLFRSSDFGANWSVSVIGLGNDVVNLAFRDASNGVAVDEDGNIARTSNGGLTWNTLAPSGPLHAISVAAVPGTSTYVSVGIDGEPGGAGSSYSTNDGQTWTAIESTRNHALVSFASATVGWSGSLLVDANGDIRNNGVLRYTGATLSTNTALAASLGLEVYPNPASDGRFTLRAPGLKSASRFTVLDALGRVVATQVWNAAALAPACLDLSGQAPGVYVLELPTPQGVVREKLVVR
ncbi:T9SS type A sorting domain-containing protein [Hymenobacter psychrotolerans]|uniref:Por secretion system C-terminal sorting domain-containing protein n=1 Tax=Hymenobacter psychrotolerans DSM 18569 TaxID=1121959 RepID=A0A1M7DXF9_9BACT|nr:T9SS type A sorting domain-containing protein [Hymenobacter psychrotolerans]SHL84083.1 Por secretion system C-terminal sorting domain-containing protein [Hymenobacter psychrotolerans DSM 18569]